MNIRLIRHATVQLSYAGHEILLDPMFASRHALRSLTIGASAHRNPLIDLPCKVSELENPDLTLITHTHFDHLDADAALSNIRMHPVVCQTSDAKRLGGLGFQSITPTNVVPVRFDGIDIYRTPAVHGHAVLGRLMGKGSGYVLKSSGEPTVYMTGDTIWGSHFAEVIREHLPDMIIANFGAARFNIGAPITLGAEDLIEIRKISPKSRIVAVHMDAINHCRLTRKELRRYLDERTLGTDVFVPDDGETVSV